VSARKDRDAAPQADKDPSAAQLLEALSSPIRRRILRVVSENPGAGPIQISQGIDINLSKVSYHVKYLSDRGVLKQTGTKQVRGALAHFYRCDFGEHGKLVRPFLKATAAEDGGESSALKP
jgi:DNA-binding transcriptional ArsR family regulator